VRGAAREILTANPLGGMCSRVCPTEQLCEEACVRNTNEDKPVEIGALQRYATDAFMAAGGAPLFQRAAATGKKVAVVGAGPAGLTCAHQLALQGHDVVLLDARPKLGGLNEYGLASYKTPTTLRRRKSTGCCRWAASRRTTTSGWGVTSPWIRCWPATTPCSSAWAWVA
jgi:glutamate synthase (NADPH/NADH) small chain